MRSTVLIALLALAVVLVWLHKSNKDSTPPRQAKSSEVSQHDWAKHALDRAADVKRQVAQQREEDGAK